MILTWTGRCWQDVKNLVPKAKAKSATITRVSTSGDAKCPQFVANPRLKLEEGSHSQGQVQVCSEGQGIPKALTIEELEARVWA